MNSSLRGKKFGKVRRLSGFRKVHSVPDRHFAAAEAFVRRIGHEEVKAQADTIHERLRAAFGFKRKDITYVCEDGAAALKTPDFDVSIGVTQDAADAASYILTTEVGSIRRPAVVDEPSFSEVFSAYCDTVVVEFDRALSVEAKIDAIEEVPELKAYLKYESDASSLTLDLPAPRLRVYVTATQMVFSSPGAGNLQTLVRSVQQALALMVNAGAPLLPSEQGAF
jgi:hypothetical protein